MLKTYKELGVWQKSFALCLRVYRLTKPFPGDERFGLTSQLRRAAVSVPSNIAEGYNRGSTGDYIRYLWIANGSLAEIETQTLLASELGFVSGDELTALFEAVEELQRMLRALIRSLKSKKTK